jgi:hypothetical protein
MAFLCTGEEPSRAEPKPIIIKLTKDGCERGGDSKESKSDNDTRAAQLAYIKSNPGTKSYYYE